MTIFKSWFKMLRINEKSTLSILYPSGKTSDQYLSRKYDVELTSPSFLSIAIDCSFQGSLRIIRNRKITIFKRASDFFNEFSILTFGAPIMDSFSKIEVQNNIRSLFREGFTEIIFRENKLKVIAEPITQNISYPYIRKVVEKLVRLEKIGIV